MFNDVCFQCETRGELLASLSYQPVSHRLSVVVLKARHLPKMDMTGLSASEYDQNQKQLEAAQNQPQVFWIRFVLEVWFGVLRGGIPTRDFSLKGHVGQF